MKYINLTEDLGKKQLEDKWKGKFLDDSCYQKVYKIEEDTAILKPIPSLDGSDNALGYFITNAYNNDNLIWVIQTHDISSNDEEINSNQNINYCIVYFVF